MQQLYSATQAPFHTAKTVEDNRLKSAVVAGTATGLIALVVMCVMPDAMSSSIQRYAPAVVARPVVGATSIATTPAIKPLDIRRGEQARVSQLSSSAQMSTPNAEGLAAPSVELSQVGSPKLILAPIAALFAAMVTYLFKGRKSQEYAPLLSTNVRNIAMASTTAVKPETEGSAAQGPRKRVLVVGPTGYIGKYATLELVNRGYDVVAMARARSGVDGQKTKEDLEKEFEGATMVYGDVTNPADIEKVMSESPLPFDTVMSCLASRSGGVADSQLIDYQATSNCLQAARNNGVRHFVLLSAICVQKPLLEFQRAKGKFEDELMAAGDITYSIVRPTAFFKSLAGQVKSVMGGGPYVMFGDGQLAACKPISERDLASFLADCVEDEDKCNKMLPIGGPGEAMTALQQGEMLFDIIDKKPFFIKVPIQLMDGVIGVLDFLKKFNPNLIDAAEFGRIGKYYASESMLVYDQAKGEYLPGDMTPSYGNDTLEAFFKSAVKEGGLEGQELGDAAVWGQD